MQGLLIFIIVLAAFFETVGHALASTAAALSKAAWRFLTGPWSPCVGGVLLLGAVVAAAYIWK